MSTTALEWQHLLSLLATLALLIFQKLKGKLQVHVLLLAYGVRVQGKTMEFLLMFSFLNPSGFVFQIQMPKH